MKKYLKLKSTKKTPLNYQFFEIIEGVSGTLVKPEEVSFYKGKMSVGNFYKPISNIIHER